MFCSSTQPSDAGEARTCGPSVSRPVGSNYRLGGHTCTDGGGGGGTGMKILGHSPCENLFYKLEVF